MKSDLTLIQNPHVDGKSFYYPNRGRQSKAGVLLIHGFTATTTEVSLLADKLHREGLCVSAPLLPGHGTTPHDLNLVKYNDWLNKVDKSYLELSQSCSTVIVGGESMGAVLGLALGLKYPQIAALLLYSPAISVSSLRVAKYLKWFKPVIQKKNYDPSDKVWQGYPVYPLFAAHEFEKLQNYVRPRLQRISQPALILHGKYDKTIDSDSSDLIHNSISSQVKEIHLMEASGHVMLLDQDLDLIASITLTFMRRLDIL